MKKECRKNLTNIAQYLRYLQFAHNVHKRRTRKYLSTRHQRKAKSKPMQMSETESFAVETFVLARGLNLPAALTVPSKWTRRLAKQNRINRHLEKQGHWIWQISSVEGFKWNRVHKKEICGPPDCSKKVQSKIQTACMVGWMTIFLSLWLVYRISLECIRHPLSGYLLGSIN